ncbi:MAG TPA: phosphate signaling complex protein PhoU [Spirochaetia bacterium]|nr:phosphate signaling complex protein PhoU [Spirochaetales bacterium]HRY73039.1 phosphate signaling complex protein PhoU [Spirochaetia bacterium]
MGNRIQLMDEMNRLHHDLLSMGTRVEEDLRKAIEALKRQDVELAKEVKADDAVVNALQLKIEDQTAVLIATQAPVARDLRELVALLKVTDNLERAGDHAVHLAKAAIKLSGEPPFRQIERLERMASVGCDMVRGAVGAYLNRDVEEARRVAALDDGIDGEHRALVQEVLELMKERPDQVQRAARLLTTSGFLERLGDHMTNVCEAVVYMVEGSHVELND